MAEQSKTQLILAELLSTVNSNALKSQKSLQEFKKDVNKNIDNLRLDVKDNTNDLKEFKKDVNKNFNNLSLDVKDNKNDLKLLGQKVQLHIQTQEAFIDKKIEDANKQMKIDIGDDIDKKFVQNLRPINQINQKDLDEKKKARTITSIKVLVSLILIIFLAILFAKNYKKYEKVHNFKVQDEFYKQCQNPNWDFQIKEYEAQSDWDWWIQTIIIISTLLSFIIDTLLLGLMCFY